MERTVPSPPVCARLHGARELRHITNSPPTRGDACDFGYAGRMHARARDSAIVTGCFCDASSLGVPKLWNSPISPDTTLAPHSPVQTPWG